MLSIDGGTYGEVFANLGTSGELDEAERHAAGVIAGWFAERDRLRASEADRRSEPGYDPSFDFTDAAGNHAGRAPFFGPTAPEAQNGQEWRTWIFGDVRFTVYPYTTGSTMNVAVDRVDRKLATPQ